MIKEKVICFMAAVGLSACAILPQPVDSEVALLAACNTYDRGIRALTPHVGRLSDEAFNTIITAMPYMSAACLGEGEEAWMNIVTAQSVDEILDAVERHLQAVLDAQLELEVGPNV